MIFNGRRKLAEKGRVVLAVLLTGAVCYMVFVLFDCIRISRTNSGTKPIITIQEEIPNGEGDICYTGLGYTVVYKIGYTEVAESDTFKIKDTRQYIKEFAYGQEIWLFNRIFLWGWIE